MQDAFETDLRRWIEGEGAYDVLRYKISGTGQQQYERLIQKTIKAQIENVLLKRGFQVEVLREPQLLDDKRTDLLIRYGFSGPIVVEVKLASNKDVQGTKLKESASYLSMNRYMQGYGAAHGIFLVIDNVGTNKLQAIAEAFQTIRGVLVMSFDCHVSSDRKGVPGNKRRGKTALKASARRRGRSRPRTRSRPRK